MPNAPPSSTPTRPAPEPAVVNGTTLGMASITDFAPSDPSHPSQNDVQKTISLDGTSTTLRALAEDLERRVHSFIERKPETAFIGAVQEQVKMALEVIDSALDRYRQARQRFPPFPCHWLPLTSENSTSHLSLSYNGGKDCLVLLILLIAALPRHFRKPKFSQDTWPETLQSVYIVSPHPFPEVDDFVELSTARYRLDLARFPSPMKPALSSYLAARPDVQAVFVGTRRTDPHGEHLTHFDMTDGDWPRFMRIHPVIDWHYAEIWAFIREVGVEYCSLYDKGYTSLGGTTDTHPNPALRKTNTEGQAASHRPAYELMDDDEERLGRDR